MKISLAPMEGVVDFVIRKLYSKLGGYDHFVTEFVRVSQVPVPAHVFRRYCPELETSGRTDEGIPVYIQLLGSDLANLAASAKTAVELGALGVDLNFGCPAKTVNRHDGGASLLKNPDRVFAVVEAVRASVPAHIPVTAKVRLGFDHKDYAVEIAQAVDSAGAQSLTIHARTKAEGYRPPAHWEYIAKMRAKVKLPVIANGDIWTVDDYFRCREITGCEDIALGRPAIAHPDLARQIKEAAGDIMATSKLTWVELQSLILPEFIQLCRNYRHEQYALNRSKQWIKFLGRHYPEAAATFIDIRRAQDITELTEKIASPCH